MSEYFSGEKLYGDDFSIEEIEVWYEDEKEGYANLGARNRHSYQYSYNALNWFHGFRFVQQKSNIRALGIGSAYGDEFEPFVSMIKELKILDPSEHFESGIRDNGLAIEYMKPNISGSIPFDDCSFGLITSLGVMHHIPNVTHVLSECYRCMSPGGSMLLREPIHSMGDWSKPRPGLTKRERGIPLSVLDETMRQIGFRIVRRQLCMFPAFSRICKKLKIETYNSVGLTIIDSILSNMFSWNDRYHRTSFIDKLAPSCVFFVATKR